MAEPKYEITKTERDISPGGHLLKEKTLTIKGENMEKIKEVFKEEWEK